MYDFTWWFFFSKLLLTGNSKSDWFVLSSPYFLLSVSFLPISFLSFLAAASCSHRLNWQSRGPLNYTNIAVDLITFWLHYKIKTFFSKSVFLFQGSFHETSFGAFPLTGSSAPCWMCQQDNKWRARSKW